MTNHAIKILVVDDEPKLVDVVKSYLELSGFVVCTAYNGVQALDSFEREAPALIILDLMMPDMTGEDVCKIIRQKSNVPIIMLTAKVEEQDILSGLNMGADDYITKPFRAQELVARVGAILRRTSRPENADTGMLAFAEIDLVIDKQKREVTIKGKAVKLTPHEYEILLAMAQQPEKTFTREELILHVWNQDFDGYDRTVDTHIKNLRQKIEPDTQSPRVILTVHGVGYKFHS